MTNYVHNQLPMPNQGVYQYSHQPMYDHYIPQPIPHFNPAQIIVKDRRKSRGHNKDLVNKHKVAGHILQNEIQTLRSQLLLNTINGEREESDED